MFLYEPETHIKNGAGRNSGIAFPFSSQEYGVIYLKTSQFVLLIFRIIKIL